MSFGRILHLEDNSGDAYLIQHWLSGGGIDSQIVLASDADSYRKALSDGQYDLILADSSVPNMSPLEALHLAQQTQPEAPFVCLSGAANESTVKTMLAAGAADFVLKDHEWRLVAVAQRELKSADRKREHSRLSRQARSTLHLMAAAQDLSRARDRETVWSIVRGAARTITGADGISIVERDHDQCHYVDEEAVAPLWKGRRFPMSSCISGWSMLHGQTAAIEDIYADARVSADMYRPTFVRSLVMVPIRRGNAVGAIGAYWRHPHKAEQEEVDLLQALADVAAATLDNVRAHQDQQQRLAERTRSLHSVSNELDALSYAISHELRTPLQAMRSTAETSAAGDEGSCRERAEQLRAAADEAVRKIDDLLQLAAITRRDLHPAEVDFTGLARRIANGLKTRDPQRAVHISIQDDMRIVGDAALLETLLSHLLGNAWKFTSQSPSPRIEVGSEMQYDGSSVHFVRDNGAGFDMTNAGRLFAPFQHLHSTATYPGSGVGLATVQRIVHRHGGEVWARARPGEGTTFYFTLGQAPAYD